MPGNDTSAIVVHRRDCRTTAVLQRPSTFAESAFGATSVAQKAVATQPQWPQLDYITSGSSRPPRATLVRSRSIAADAGLPQQSFVLPWLRGAPLDHPMPPKRKFWPAPKGVSLTNFWEKQAARGDTDASPVHRSDHRTTVTVPCPPAVAKSAFGPAGAPKRQFWPGWSAHSCTSFLYQKATWCSVGAAAVHRSGQRSAIAAAGAPLAT